jgi:tetratricopeptide (TPR) repeat protein
MLRFLWAYLVYTWGGLHRYFGNQNSLRSEHEAAVRYFSKAYAIDPTFRRVRLERGVLLFRELGRMEEALADFDALLAEDPTYAPALFNRALLAQQNGRYHDALADLKAYTALSPNEYQKETSYLISLLQDLIDTQGR